MRAGWLCAQGVMSLQEAEEQDVDGCAGLDDEEMDGQRGPSV